jgi:hypothetical protein
MSADPERARPPEDGSNAGRPSPASAIVEWGLIGVSYFMLLFGRHVIGADGNDRFDAMSQLFERHALSSSKFSLIGPLFSAPLWFVGKWFGDPKLGCVRYNWLLLGVFLVLLWRLLRDQLDATSLRRFLLLLVAGSMFPNHVQAYYAEVFTAACVALGVLCVCLKRAPWLGWIAIVLGTANTPGVALGTIAVCLAFAIDRRRVRYVLPLLAVGILIGAEAVLRKGGKTGYEGVHQAQTLMPYSGRPGFSYPLFLGLLSLVLSYGKGIVFYAPGVFAPVTEFLRSNEALLRAYRTWLLFLGGLLVVYAKFCGWYGGVFWGPRYLLFVSVPASFALALNLGRERTFGRSLVTFVMLTQSIWVCADGMVFGQANLGACWANDYALEHLCWYVPEFSAWIRPFVASRALVPLDFFFLGVYLVVYLYLAAPIAAFLARAALAWCSSRVRRWLDWRAWEF